VDFISFYIEIPIMVFMILSWILARNIGAPIPPSNASLNPPDESTPLMPHDAGAPPHRARVFDIVDIQAINLFNDEYPDSLADRVEDETKGTRFPLFRKLYDMLA